MDQVQTALQTLSAVARDNEPVIGVYSLFSGGTDSLTATSVAAQHPMFRGVLHINTGIGIEATHEYVRDMCKREGWPLTELHPPGRSYEDLVIEYGFPGPGGHAVMYRWLKERAVRLAIKRIKAEAGMGRFARVLLATGARTDESSRRMRNAGETQRLGSQVWVPVIASWTKLDTRRYVEARGYPSNPASDLLHMSGECLCGSFARPGELDEIALWFPADAARIRELEDRVRAVGKPCVWGARPHGPHSPDKTVGPLCSTCEANG